MQKTVGKPRLQNPEVAAIDDISPASRYKNKDDFIAETCTLNLAEFALIG